MIKKILILSVSLILLSGFVLADTATPQDFTYLFHLYYGNSTLVVDRDAQFKYDVLPETFVAETLSTQFPYKGEVIDLKGEVAETFQFDPRQGNPNFLKGTISVKAPYVPDGQKVNFYDAQGNQLLSIFVSESSFCNDDGVCNADIGEDHTTCPSDCKTATPIPTVTTGPSAGGGGMINILIYTIIGLGVAAGGWYGWKWWQKRKQSSTTDIPTYLPPNPTASSNNPLQ